MPRRPLAGSPVVSCDNACHRRRTPPSGGTDYAVPVGTDVLAPVSGFYYYNDNAATGYGLRVRYNDRTIYLSHLLSREGRSGQWFDEGQRVALSGGRPGHPGAGSSTGPHLHAEVVIAGTREGMEEWLRAVNGPDFAAGGGTIPITPEQEESGLPVQITIREPDGSTSVVPAELAIADIFARSREAAAGVQELRFIDWQGTPQPFDVVMRDVLAVSQQSEARLTALTAAVSALAANAGASPEAVLAVVRDSVREALGDLSFTITPNV